MLMGVDFKYLAIELGTLGIVIRPKGVDFWSLRVNFRPLGVYFGLERYFWVSLIRFGSLGREYISLFAYFGVWRILLTLFTTLNIFLSFGFSGSIMLCASS